MRYFPIRFLRGGAGEHKFCPSRELSFQPLDLTACQSLSPDLQPVLSGLHKPNSRFVFLQEACKQSPSKDRRCNQKRGVPGNRKSGLKDTAPAVTEFGPVSPLPSAAANKRATRFGQTFERRSNCPRDYRQGPYKRRPQDCDRLLSISFFSNRTPRCRHSPPKGDIPHSKAKRHIPFQRQT